MQERLATSRSTGSFDQCGDTHLQYADDTMVMVEQSELDIINHEFLILCFESMSRLKINFTKSEVVVIEYLLEE